MSTWVIGDIHGAAKALEQVFARAPIQPDDRIIQLGDIADGWGEVDKCVSMLLDKSIRNDLICIRGNHDEWALSFLETGVMESHHRMLGGVGTYNSYMKDGKLEIPAAHIEFFRRQIRYYKDHDSNIYIHGGFNRHYTLEEHDDEDIFWWDRDLWLSALSYKDIVTFDIADGKEQGKFKIKEPCNEIFLGHTTTTNWRTDKPMHAANIWNVDTGAGFRGRLTIMNVETKEFYQSDRVELLYPDEKGRN